MPLNSSRLFLCPKCSYTGVTPGPVAGCEVLLSGGFDCGGGGGGGEAVVVVEESGKGSC